MFFAVWVHSPHRIGIWKCWFLRRGKNWSSRTNTSRIKDDNQQQTQTRSTWWEASALFTASPQLPVNNVHLNHLWKRFTTPKYQPKFIGLTLLEVGKGIMKSFFFPSRQFENPTFRCLFCRLASLSPPFLLPSPSLITSSLLQKHQRAYLFC